MIRLFSLVLNYSPSTGMMETGLRTYMWHFFASEQPPVQQCANDTTLTILKGVLKMRDLIMEQKNLERIRYMTAWVPLFASCASLRKQPSKCQFPDAKFEYKNTHFTTLHQ